MRSVQKSGCRLLPGILVALACISVALPSCVRNNSNSKSRVSVIEDSRITQIRDTGRLRQIIDSLEVYGPSRELSLAYYQLGIQARFANDFVGSVEILKKALEIAEEGKDTILITRNLNNIAVAYRRLTILDDASYYYYKSLRYVQDYSDQLNVDILGARSSICNGLGNINLELSNYDRAEQYFRTALDCSLLLSDQTGQAMNYSDIGYTFKARNQLDSAQSYFRKSMDINLKANDTKGVALNHTAFGEMYEAGGDYEKALTEYGLAVDQLSLINDVWNMVPVYISEAECYLSLQNYTKSREMLDVAAGLLGSVHSYEYNHKYWNAEYRLNESLGNLTMAFESFKTSVAYKDSIVNESARTGIANDQVQYVLDTRDSELERIQRSFNIERKNHRSTLVISILFLLILVGAVVILWEKLKMRIQKHRLLQKVDDDRYAFVTNITHEFRTPLTVILGLAHELDSNTGLDSKQIREMSSAIVRQGRDLLRLVNQLLDINKVNSTIGKIDWRHGDIVPFIHALIDPYVMHSRQRNVDLAYFPGEVSLEIDFVPDFLQKIIVNLVGNSMKYTPEGGHIYISTVRVGNTLILKVMDTGTGMTEETRAHLFEPFYTGGDKPSDISTGIGLFLTYKLIEAMGGNINVRSEEGKGSTFTVCLPVLCSGNGEVAPYIEDDGIKSEEEPIKSDGPELLPGGDEESLADPLVLVVEDNRDVAYYIGTLLERDYRLCYASNGISALEMAREQVPDIIVTDIRMPEMDGLHLVRDVRSDEVLAHVPIIVVTAVSDEAERLRFIEAGADTYMVKPIDTMEFKAQLHNLLKQRTILREKYSQSASYASQGDVDGSSDLSKYDKAFLAKFVDYVLASLSQDKPADIASIASHMCVSPRQLSRKINAMTGESTSAYVNRIKLNKAKQLLDADMATPIADIAMSCGFEDMSYFGKIFRQYEGLTPSQYRKRVK